jgi:hypothetical protein
MTRRSYRAQKKTAIGSLWRYNGNNHVLLISHKIRNTDGRNWVCAISPTYDAQGMIYMRLCSTPMKYFLDMYTPTTHEEALTQGYATLEWLEALYRAQEENTAAQR